MRIGKSRAIELMDEKISKFMELKDEMEKKYFERFFKVYFEEKYQILYHGAMNLLAELFSKEEVEKFEELVVDFKPETAFKSVERCIIQLESYRERIQEFWPDDESESTKKLIIPFVSMNFREKDSDINRYFTGILDALQIEFETGERYSKESIPEKVKNRIKSCDLLIGILVKRDETINGKFKTPEWLIKEIGIAQGAGKDVIVLVEKGITDIAGLRSEKEIIYFEQDNAKEIQTATLKFLEALKEHGLV